MPPVAQSSLSRILSRGKTAGLLGETSKGGEDTGSADCRSYEYTASKPRLAAWAACHSSQTGNGEGAPFRCRENARLVLDARPQRGAPPALVGPPSWGRIPSRREGMACPRGLRPLAARGMVVPVAAVLCQWMCRGMDPRRLPQFPCVMPFYGAVPSPRSLVQSA